MLAGRLAAQHPHLCVHCRKGLGRVCSYRRAPCLLNGCIWRQAGMSAHGARAMLPHFRVAVRRNQLAQGLVRARIHPACALPRCRPPAAAAACKQPMHV